MPTDLRKKFNSSFLITFAVSNKFTLNTLDALYLLQNSDGRFKKRRKFLFFGALTIFALFSGFYLYRAVNVQGSSTQNASLDPTDKESLNFRGADAVNNLKKNGEHDSLAEAITVARYKVEKTSEGARVFNHANQMRGTFTGEGLRLRSNSGWLVRSR